jgi:hypothetical protein
MRMGIGRVLRNLVEWCGVIVLALRVMCRRLGVLIRGRALRVPA